MASGRVQEWEAQTGRLPVVPADYTRALAYQGSLSLDKGLLRFACVRFEVLGYGWIRLHDVLLDTSERYQGITLQAKVTYRQELTVFCSSAAIMPIDADGPGFFAAPPAGDGPAT